jgi:citrate lyase subunit beta/citryl-CoA lyase
MNSRIARSYLYVPGSRPDRFDKACAAGAYAVIIDLEDAVPPGDKVAAQRSGGAAVALDGRMIDRPVILKAERIVRDAGDGLPQQ